MSIAAYIDHTLLRPIVSNAAIDQLCIEAVHFKFAGACVPPSFVRRAKHILHGSQVKLVTVIGFPLGYDLPETKWRAIELALTQGADEIDVVHNQAALFNQDYDALCNEIGPAVELCHTEKKVIKIILESGQLQADEIRMCCELYASLGVDYIKTSTGFSNVGARVEDVVLMRKLLPEAISIKASGGIRDLQTAALFIQAGASRIGTSSGVAIVESAKD